jgi:hypothetical protein
MGGFVSGGSAGLRVGWFGHFGMITESVSCRKAIFGVLVLSDVDDPTTGRRISGVRLDET